MSSRNKKGIVCVIASAIVFGMMPLITKTAYALGANAYMAALGRFFFGSIMLFVLCRIKKKNVVINKKEMKNMILVSLPYSFVPVTLYISYNYIGSGLATTLHFTYPILVVLLSVFFLNKKITLKQNICEVIGFAGILLLSSNSKYGSLAGITIAILSGLLYAVYITSLDKITTNSIDELVLSFWVSVISFVIISIVTLFTNNFVITGDYRVTLLFIVLGLLATAFGLRLFQKGVFLCGPIKASLLSTLEPITGILLGMYFFNERIEIGELIGILLILVSACIVVLPDKKKQK